MAVRVTRAVFIFPCASQVSFRLLQLKTQTIFVCRAEVGNLHPEEPIVQMNLRVIWFLKAQEFVVWVISLNILPGMPVSRHPNCFSFWNSHYIHERAEGGFLMVRPHKATQWLEEQLCPVMPVGYPFTNEGTCGYLSP